MKTRQLNNDIIGIWEPKKGEKLNGFFGGVMQFDTDKYNNDHFIITDGDGKCIIVNGYAVLKNRLSNVEKNDFVSIKYTGDNESKNGNTYKSFIVKAVILESDEEIKEYSDKYQNIYDASFKESDQKTKPKEEAPVFDDDDDLPF